MNKQQELEYIAKYNIKNGTHFYNLEQIVNHASQNSKPEKQSALQRIGSALVQSEGRSATEKAILDGSAEATSKKLQEVGIDKESANQSVINPAYNTDKTTAALNTTLLTLLPDISAGIPGIIRLGTGMMGGYLGNRGGKYLDDKFGTSFLQGIGSFAGGLAGYSFGNKTIPDIINSAIIRKNLKTGKLEFVGPKNYTGYHQSNTYFETPQFPFNNRWDVINHNADPNGFFLTLNNPATSGFLAKRPYILKFNINSNKGLVQHGEIEGFSGSKNNIRNKIVKYARRNGADVVHFDGIKDNTLPNQQILFATDKSGIKSLNSRENLPAIYNSEETTPTILNITDNLISDINTGKQDALNFLSSTVKKETDAHNKALAKRLGLKIVQTPERKIRLYRAQPVNPVFNPSSAANGEAQKEFAGKWFTPNIEKVDWYAHNASVKGVPAELQFVEIPESQLKKYAAEGIIPKGFDFEPTEDYIIPEIFKRTTIPYNNTTRIGIFGSPTKRLIEEWLKTKL